jgi:acetyl esterase/lipase
MATSLPYHLVEKRKNMTLRFTLVSSLLLLGAALSGQRYWEPAFSAVDSQTFEYAEIAGEKLYLDLYTPARDTARKKPLLIYVHGGGFSGGKRNETGFVALARYLAERGYAVASISYRLTMRGESFSCDQPTPNKIATFRAAAEDIWAATRYAITQQSTWGIDPSRIVLSGSSAGAEAILYAAYGRAADPVDQLPKAFRYAGLISMAGAIIEVKWITAESAIPSLLFHGTCDNLVPYATAPHHYCQPGDPGYLILHGARSIADRHQQLGRPYHLFTSCGGAHGWAGRPIVEQQATIVDFLYRDVIKQAFRQIHTVVRQPEGACSYFEQPFNYCVD